VLKVITGLFKVIWMIAKIPLFALAILAAAFLISLFVAVMLQYFQGKRFKKGEHLILGV